MSQRLVLDASAAVDLLLQREGSGSLTARIASTQLRHAPHIIDVEVAHVLRRLVRIGDLRSLEGAEALNKLADFRLYRHAHWILFPSIWRRRENLTAYDAAYVALAEALGATLLTCDQRLAAAAKDIIPIEVL